MSVTDELLTGQAQHLIGALIAHNLLPKSMPSEQYLSLWDVVKRQLNAVNKEGARAIQEEAYKAGMAAERERCLSLCTQVDEDGEGPDCWGWHAKDYAKAIQEVK
jgi:hypothetical protein